MPDAETLEILGVGPIKIQAEQLGNKNYNPAASVAREILVPKVPQAIDWNQEFTDRLYGELS